MRELIKPFLFLILLIPFATVTNAYAFTCGGVECKSGEYCGTSGPDATKKCIPCSLLSPEGQYTHSDINDDPAKGTGVCYKICGADDGWPDRPGNVDKGKWVPKPNEYGEYKAYYNSACEYDLECDNYTNHCEGFHPDDQNKSCIANKQECTVENGSGFKYWVFDATGTGAYVNNGQCFLTACSEGYHLKESGQYICQKPYGECVSNTAECASLLKNCGGTITGNAEWNGTGWNYDNCRCETDNGPIENGTGSSSCPWDSDEGDWSTDCERDVVTCHVGYCEHKDHPGSCAAARPGWYHDNNTDAECQPCPAGMTSDGTNKDNIADSIEKCGIRTGPKGTRFCDSNGCFTLPGNGELIYYKAW